MANHIQPTKKEIARAISLDIIDHFESIKVIDDYPPTSHLGSSVSSAQQCETLEDISTFQKALHNQLSNEDNLDE